MRLRIRVALLVAVVASIACADGESGGDDEWRTTTVTRGDTTFVRTTGVREDAASRELVAEWSIGSAEGNTPYSFGRITEVAIGPANDVFVFDRQPLLLRQYDSTGSYVRSIGRAGEGPGEYTGANGFRVHRDGRTAIWDRGNRVLFFDAKGEPIGSTPVPGPGRFSTSGAMRFDTLGNSYIRTQVGDPPPPGEGQRGADMFPITGLVRYGPDGSVRDSLRPPAASIEVPNLIARSGNGMAVYPVPFSPDFLWTFSPHGYFVSGRGDVYAIHLSRPDGRVTRIEMEMERVPVSAGEKREQEESTINGLRMTDPTWRWSGPAIPDTKPYFDHLWVSDDGRIWVSIARPAEEIPAAERGEPFVANGETIPPRAWRVPVVYDVFDPDGRYVGRVPVPRRTSLRAARGDIVWAVTRDSLDVEQITRFRVSPGFPK